jgi:predicted DNA binding CopG/RHH family protein
MRKEYDFSKSRKNLYAKQLKSQITIRLDTAAVNYFKQMAAELGMHYQNLINLYLAQQFCFRATEPFFERYRLVHAASVWLSTWW